MGRDRRSLRDVSAKTLRRAVALVPFGIVAVDLDQLHVVHVAAIRARNGVQIHLVAVRRQFDSITQTAFHVLKKLRRGPSFPPAHQPANNELGICVDGGRRPYVACNPLLTAILSVMFFSLQQQKFLIDLYALRSDITNRGVLVLRAGVANFRPTASEWPARTRQSCEKSPEPISLLPARG